MIAYAASIIISGLQALCTVPSLCYCSADGSADAAGGGAVAGRKAVDFENLSFAQGNHLMTNKKCDLPQKSYRAAHKASESVIPVCTPCLHACGYRFVRLVC